MMPQSVCEWCYLWCALQLVPQPCFVPQLAHLQPRCEPQDGIKQITPRQPRNLFQTTQQTGVHVLNDSMIRCQTTDGVRSTFAN